MNRPSLFLELDTQRYAVHFKGEEPDEIESLYRRNGRDLRQLLWSAGSECGPRALRTRKILELVKCPT